MKIRVPENPGGALRTFEDDTYDVAIMDMFHGQSKTGNAKLTVKYVIRSEYSGKHSKTYKSTVGENVLETFSLQEQAIWNLNDLHKQVTGENLPQGDYDVEEFVQLIKDRLLGAEGRLDLVQDSSTGNPRMVVRTRYFGE